MGKKGVVVLAFAGMVVHEVIPATEPGSNGRRPVARLTALVRLTASRAAAGIVFQRNAKLTNVPYLHLAVLIVALVGLAALRFNRQGAAPAPPADNVQYQMYVEYFRGASDGSGLSPASSWRPLVPLLASPLPFAPQTSINLVNLASLVGALLLVLILLADLGVGKTYSVAGGILFTISFPTFYYSTIGYVDPLMIFLLCLGVLMAQRGRYAASIVVLGLGVFAKEGILVLLPFLGTVAFMKSGIRAGTVVFIAGLAVYVIMSAVIREMAPGSREVSFWTPRLTLMIENAARPRAWLSFALSAGLPALLTIASVTAWRKADQEMRRKLTPFLVGAFAVLMTWIFAFVSAHVDGRTIWASYPFTVPISALYLQMTDGFKIRTVWPGSQGA